MDQQFKETVTCLAKAQVTLPSNQIALTEVITRIEGLADLYSSLMDSNVKYLAMQNTKVSFDPSSDTITYEYKGRPFQLKLNRADPNVPMKLEASTTIMGFVPKPASQSDDLHHALERKIGIQLESYYYAASRVWDIVEKDLLGKGKSEFIGVKMVRNKLIEHSENGAVFSFGGADPNGPRVKPIQNTSRKEKWNDLGLKPNTFELLSKIQSRLNNFESLNVG